MIQSLFNKTEIFNFAAMIAIDNKLVSNEIIEAQFVCDLNKCKGACCVEGDAGAPLEKGELDQLNAVYELVLPYLDEQSRSELEKQGRYVYDREYGWVTPAINGKVCVYGFKDKSGIVKCGIEQAYLDGKITWKKPISCHLFPITTKKSKNTDKEYVNYEPREDHCKPGCMLGEKLKMPVYVFLKEALVRKFGQPFYDALEATAMHIQNKPQKTKNKNHQ